MVTSGSLSFQINLALRLFETRFPSVGSASSLFRNMTALVMIAVLQPVDS